MGAPDHSATARAAAMRPRFDAWRTGETGVNYRLEIDASTLEEAVTQALQSCGHGATFFIRAVDALSGKRCLHFYTVKQQSKPSYVRKPGFAHTVAIKPLYASPLCKVGLAGGVDPEEPWQWTPGCDPVGIDRSIVEQRP